MTLVTLRPNSTISTTGTGTAGGAAHAVTSDNSDATALLLDQGEDAYLDLADLALPVGALVKSVAVRARLTTSTTNATVQFEARGIVAGQPSLIVGAPVTINSGFFGTLTA